MNSEVEKKINISAIVVGRNEAEKLRICLATLYFCDEILYADLDSVDDSIAVASELNCKVFHYTTFGPSCEYAQSDLIHKVKNDWVIMLDPDEALTEELQQQIVRELPSIAKDPNIGDVYVPWQFYFGNTRLKGTVWGYEKYKGILVHKGKYEIKPVTHYGRKLKDGFTSYQIAKQGNNVLDHFWMDNMTSFIKKHKKYLKDEGQDRYNMGQRITILGVVYNFFYQFFRCYVLAKGYKDGLTGLFLSLFWNWYSFVSNISLYRIAIKLRKNEN